MPSRNVNAATRLAGASWRRDKICDKLNHTGPNYVPWNTQLDLSVLVILHTMVFSAISTVQVPNPAGELDRGSVVKCGHVDATAGV